MPSKIADIVIESLKVLTPFVAALLAYWLGARSYFRQKEFELVRNRYLEAGVDKVSAQVEDALNIATHNFQHVMKILRVLRDIGPKRAVHMFEGFRALESGSLELIAINRLQEIVQDNIFWDVRQLLYSAVQENHTLLVDDLGSAINELVDGAVFGTSKEAFLREYESQIVKGYLNINRFSLLLSCLNQIASILQAQRLSLKSVRSFHKQEIVTEAAAKLKKEFGGEIKPLDDELRSMGINPGTGMTEGKQHNPTLNRTETAHSSGSAG
jgi:hypothetical protein